MLAFAVALGWVLGDARRARVPVRYHVNASICESLSLWEEAHFGRAIACESAMRSIEDAFAQWAVNSREVGFLRAARDESDLLVGDMLLAPGTAAVNHNFVDSEEGIASSVVRLNRALCWYSTGACDAFLPLFGDAYLHSYAVAFASIAACVACVAAWRRPLRRALLACLSLALPALYLHLYVTRSCADCASLTNALMHEVGHSLGFGHSNDEAANVCGCGGSVEACQDSGASVMHSFSTRSRCLSQSDAHGLQTAYGDECGAVVCSPSPQRVHEYALLHRFLAAWLAAACVCLLGLLLCHGIAAPKSRVRVGIAAGGHASSRPE